MSERAVLVVPCYNEAVRFDVDAFVAFVRSHPGVRLIFVNDGSRDETLAVLQRTQALAPDRVEVIDLHANVGKAEAVRRGMLSALTGDVEYVGFWDADLATPLEEFSAFVERLDRHPALAMVFGSRVRLLGRVIERNAGRHYSGRVFATAASLVLNLPVYDTQCGAKLFRVSPRLRGVFEQPFLSRWIFDVEIIARFGAAGSSQDPLGLEDVVYEHPLLEWRDITGSKRKARDVVRAAFDLARIRWTYRRGRKS